MYTHIMDAVPQSSAQIMPPTTALEKHQWLCPRSSQSFYNPLSSNKTWTWSVFHFTQGSTHFYSWRQLRYVYLYSKGTHSKYHLSVVQHLLSALPSVPQHSLRQAPDFLKPSIFPARAHKRSSVRKHISITHLLSSQPMLRSLIHLWPQTQSLCSQARVQRRQPLSYQSPWTLPCHVPENQQWHAPFTWARHKASLQKAEPG